MPYYAVACGRRVGVYETWDDCKQQIERFQGARYRKFPSMAEAEKFIKENRALQELPSKSLPSNNCSNINAAVTLTTTEVASGTGSFYAVAVGREVGIFNTWNECSDSVNAYPGARYKKFPTFKEAESFVQTFSTQKKMEEESSPKKMKTDENNSASNEGIEKKKAYYVVARGREPGIYHSWPTCQEQIKEFNFPVYRKFFDLEEAKKFLAEKCPTAVIDLSRAGPSKPQNMNSRFKNPDIVKYKHVKYSSVKYGRYHFNIDPRDPDYVHVFTDGGCTKNGKRGAKAGIGVWFNKNHPLNVSEPVRGPPTNNVAEIEAAIKAVQIAKSVGIKKLQINTDSQFLINSMTLWVKKWEANKWLLSDGTKVKNKTQFQELLAEMENVEVKWVWVKAHFRTAGNEGADELARNGVKQYKN